MAIARAGSTESSRTPGILPIGPTVGPEPMETFVRLYRDTTGFGGTLIIWRRAFRWGSHVRAGLSRWTFYRGPQS